MIKRGHPFVRAAVPHNRTDLISIHILPYQLGSSQVGTAFSSAGLASMAKGAVLAEKRSPLLDQIWRIFFRSSRDVFLYSARRLRFGVGRSLRRTNCEAQKQSR